MTAGPRKSGSSSKTGLIDARAATEVITADGIGDAVERDKDDLFIEDAAHWFQEWLDIASENRRVASAPALFIFGDDVPLEAISSDFKPAPSFRHSHDQAISGHVHVCSLELKNVRRSDKGFKDSTGALQWLAESSFSGQTVVVVIPREKVALVHRAGDDLDDCGRLQFGDPTFNFNFDQVDQLLSKFHNEWTSTHQANCRVWKKANARVLKEGPEHMIQANLKGFFDLTIRPRGAHVAEEYRTRLGRSDLALVRTRPGRKPETCVMELKVLFPTYSSTENRDWALEGVKQVTGYRDSQDPPGPAYLCCYDGRRIHEDADIPEVVKAASDNNVTHRRYYMSTPGNGI